MKDRIASLLGAGISPKLVASAVGCTESYISQLLKNEEFVLSVASMRCAEIETIYGRDKKWDSLEDAFIEKLENLLPMILRPRDVLQALVVINNAKRRSTNFGSGDQSPTHLTQNIVVLQLPTRTVNEFSLNSQNEIIQIGERALTAMPTSALLKELNENDSTRKIPPPATAAKSRSQERVLDENSV